MKATIYADHNAALAAAQEYAHTHGGRIYDSSFRTCVFTQDNLLYECRIIAVGFGIPTEDEPFGPEYTEFFYPLINDK